MAGTSFVESRAQDNDEKQKIYIYSSTISGYSSPQYDLLGGNAGLSFYANSKVLI